MAEDGWTARRPWRRGRVAGHAPGMAGAGPAPQASRAYWEVPTYEQTSTLR